MCARRSVSSHNRRAVAWVSGAHRLETPTDRYIRHVRWITLACITAILIVAGVLIGLAVRLLGSQEAPPVPVASPATVVVPAQVSCAPNQASARDRLTNALVDLIEGNAPSSHDNTVSIFWKEMQR